MSIITVAHTMSMGHRLPSYAGICASPHGHNIIVEAQIVVPTGFLDFKDVSYLLQEILVDWDHAMVLQVNDPLVSLCEAQSWRHVVLNVEPTTEAIAEYIFRQIEYTVRTADPRKKIHSVTVHETAKYSATCTQSVSETPVMRIR